MTATIVVSGPFDGPNFVSGIAAQSKNYKVINSTTAVLNFKGGEDDSIGYRMTLHGTGFGKDADGRFTGVVTGFTAIDKTKPDTSWHVTGYNAPLELVNTQASSPYVNFPDVLISPNAWIFLGDAFADDYAGGQFNDVLKGRGGNDSLKGFAGDDTIRGGSGKDTLQGNDGDDTITGGRHADTIGGGAGDDMLYGNNGNDILKGGGDNDEIFGGNGEDKILGGIGNDSLFGEQDDDTISGGDGADTIRGGSGKDILNGGALGDTIYGGNNSDIIHGDKGVDVLFGGNSGDFIFGDGGIDKLFGDAGDDVIAGGAGSDFIDGGSGDDVLSGNKSGSVTPDFKFDSFIFIGEFGDDIITDFELGFDLIAFGGGINFDDLSFSEIGADVLITVDFLGTQTVRVVGVKDQFDPAVDILFN